MARAYLYAVTDCPDNKNLGAIGIGSPSTEVEVVSRRGIGIALSYISDPDFAPTIRDVRSHQEVLETLMSHYTVLPFSFATLAESWEAVEKFIAAAREDFLAQIDRLRDRVEVGLKVFWKKDAMRDELARAGVSMTPPQGDGANDRYNRAVQVGQAVENTVLEWRFRYVPQIEAAISPVCEAARETAPFGVTMLWNASFLVARGKEPAMRAVIHNLDARLGDRLDFRYVAPLPPYNFVDLRYPREESS